jgi:hypothetical protein
MTSTPDRHRRCASTSPSAAARTEGVLRASGAGAASLLGEAVRFSLSDCEQLSDAALPPQCCTPPARVPGQSRTPRRESSRSPAQREASPPQCCTPPARASGQSRMPQSSRSPAQHEAEQCPICMEDVETTAPTPSCSLKPPRAPFRTGCCKQLFHRACMQQYRECAADHAGCPLCRSTLETGLTPLEARSSRFRARTVAAAGGRDAMLARAAAARHAVQVRVAADAERWRHQMDAAAARPFDPLFDSDF